MAKKTIKLTESNLRKLISEAIGEIAYRKDYGNEEEQVYDRAQDIAEAKSKVGNFLKDIMTEYRLTREEMRKILNTMQNYFCSENME
jgi:hypothetical protein